MELMLGIDLGTSYFKVGLFSPSGTLKGLGRCAVQTSQNDGRRREVTPENFWKALRESLNNALQQAGADRSQISGIGYSSQANSFLLTDETFSPLTPLMLWSGTRGDDLPAELRRLWVRKDFLHITGHGGAPSNHLAASKMLWIRKHLPDVWKKAEHFMTISDYLVHSLTGQRKGDAGTATMTGLIEPRNTDWWAEALKTLDIPRRMLPDLLRPGSVAGYTTENAERHIGLPAGIPLAVGSLDHHVASLGAGVGTIARISESTGTVIACICIKDQYEPRKGVCTGPGFGRNYYQLAFDGNGASVLEWYQKKYAADMSVGELIELTRSTPPDNDGLRAKKNASAYNGLEGFKNRRPSHTPANYARAIIESVNHTLLELTDQLFPEGRPERMVATGGGARSDFWLQKKADLLGVEILRTACQEPACLGAGMIAATAAGFFGDLNEAGEQWISIENVFRPTSAPQ